MKYYPVIPLGQFVARLIQVKNLRVNQLSATKWCFRALSLAVLTVCIAGPSRVEAYDVCSDNYAGKGVDSCSHEKMFDEALMLYEHLALSNRFKAEILEYKDSIREGVGAPDEEDPLYNNGESLKTIIHFWEPDNSFGQPMVWGTDPYPNAFNAAQSLWTRALGEYAAGNKLKAYKFLGMIAHFLGDQTVPAHANGDTHPEVLNDGDPFEEWMSNPLLDKASLTTGERTALESQGLVEFPDYETNEKLLWLFLNVNQVGGYFGSDDNEGDDNLPSDARYPWADAYANEALADVIVACGQEGQPGETDAEKGCPTTSDRIQNNDKNTYPYYYDENTGADDDLSLIRTHSYVPGVRRLAALFTLWEESVKTPILTLTVHEIEQTGETDNAGCELDPLSPDGTSGLDGCNNPDLYVAIVMGSRRENTPPGTRLESDDVAHTYRSEAAGVVDMDYANVTRKDTYSGVALDRRNVVADYHFGQAFKPDPVTGVFIDDDKIKLTMQVHDADDNAVLAPYEDDDIAFIHKNGTGNLELYVDLAKCSARTAGGIEIYNDRYAECASSTENSNDTLLVGGGRGTIGQDPDTDFGEDPEDVDVSFSISIFAPDLAPPVITCELPAVDWSDTDVSITCTAVDEASDLEDPADASFELWTDVTHDTETANALTDTREVCDTLGNCVIVGPIGGNKVDKKAPEITIAQPAATQYAHSATLVLGYTVTDGGSGVSSVTTTMDGSATVAGHGLADGQAINLLTALPLGYHFFDVDADDAVGNVRLTEAVAFEIIVTSQSIIDGLVQFRNSGDVKSKQFNSLIKKLRGAKVYFDAGNCIKAENNYAAFINEVQGQLGKGITPIAAAILIADARYLISHCGI